jgi:hypothetical protein
MRSGMVSPAMQLPSTRVTDTPRPRKKQKINFNGDLVTPVAPPPSQQLASKDARSSSSHEGPPTSIHKSTSEAVVLSFLGPTMSHTSSQAENLEADPADLSRRKRKRRISAPAGEESLLEDRASNHGDVTMLPDTGKKRSRKDQTAASVMSTGT